MQVLGIETALVFFLRIAQEQSLAIWGPASSELGGLDFGTSDVGNVMTSNGAALVLFQVFGYAQVVRCLGLTWTFRIGAFLLVPFSLLSGLASYISNRTWMWVFLLLTEIGKTLTIALTMGSSMVMIIHAVPPPQVGQANGLAQMWRAAAQMIAPLVIGQLFDWSLNSGNPFPFNYFFIFFFCGILSLLILIFSFGIKRHLDHSFGGGPSGVDDNEAMSMH
eukprot:TRINITY_DN9946_c1_g1_i2.p3 TRINITY_DN9946_c1_g1~~TRINITY_DN9946_c1_g1_i2.p3  ORF type:complete len:221 (-),score=74.00 TRINITY_DN9946_c1_g1_i2:104-766(-)